MGNFWQALEQLPGLVAVPAAWRAMAGEDFDLVHFTLLRGRASLAESFPCSRGCGCAHRVVDRGGGTFAGVCDCESWNCEDIPLTRADVTPLELNWSKLGRAVAKALECDAKESALGLTATKQIAAFANAALPVVLTIQHDAEEFRSVVAQLAARLRGRFILLAPTRRWFDAGTQELLAHANAGFFALESYVTVGVSGLRASKSAGELFSPFLPEMKEAVTDDEARKLFVLLEQLDSETLVRKAPVSQVFRLYCVEGLSRNAVAKRCGCVPTLITERLRVIEERLGRKPIELRGLSSQFEQIDDSLSDSRASHIHRKSAIDDGESDEE
jgi:hypothetical protein